MPIFFEFDFNADSNKNFRFQFLSFKTTHLAYYDKLTNCYLYLKNYEDLELVYN